MVEWKKLGEVCLPLSKAIIKQGDLLDNGCYPVINSGVTLYGRYNEYNNEGNAFTFASRGEYAGFITFLSNPFWAGGLCYPYRSKDENKFITKYVFQYLKNKEKYIMDTLVMRGGIPALNKADVEKIPIPLPSLSEQERIVGILDTFTSSIENLKAQISLRRKQYEHYRDKLLDLEGRPGVEMKTLGEIGTFIRGNGIQKNDFREGGFGCIHYGQIHARYGFIVTETISKIDESLYKRCKKAQKGDVVLATTSEDAEGVAKPVVWLGEGDVAVSGDAFIYHHNQNGKFMGYQFLTHKFMQFKIKYATGAKVVRISGDNMAKFEVPLPSLEEQSRIVSILDEFEASIKNLEAQLEARDKQYEYYRNKLLTFE